MIDEAEIHLNYDAQAELINIFTEQKFASKIIYTTHSVGCLPEDLGTGVKLIVPLNKNNSDQDEVEKSIIKNNFWSEDKRPGVLPLLFGMGASQLTFMAIRKCVFVEGATDMLLLPTLFRQVSQKDYLGFQVLPGIANTAKANFGLLPNNAPKVAFLVDNDEAGEKYRKQLEESGIEPGKIFKLPHLGKVIEDYIRKELYLEVIRKQINNWNEVDTEISIDIPENNRPKYVDKWCDNSQLKKTNKVEVAYSLLDLATNERQEQLTEDSLRNDLLELYKQIIESLNIE